MTAVTEQLLFKNVYRLELIRNGEVIEEREAENLIPNEGLNRIIQNYYKGVAYTAAFNVGIKAAGTAVAADTMSSHPSWVELVSYYEAIRPILVLGTVGSQSVDNSASVAIFSISATCSVAGAFITTSDVKGGTVGTLCGVADFGAAVPAQAGDVIRVTVTLTAASA